MIRCTDDVILLRLTFFTFRWFLLDDGLLFLFRRCFFFFFDNGRLGNRRFLRRFGSLGFFFFRSFGFLGRCLFGRFLSRLLVELGKVDLVDDFQAGPRRFFFLGWGSGCHNGLFHRSLDRLLFFLLLNRRGSLGLFGFNLGRFGLRLLFCDRSFGSRTKLPQSGLGFLLGIQYATAQVCGRQNLFVFLFLRIFHIAKALFTLALLDLLSLLLQLLLGRKFLEEYGVHILGEFCVGVVLYLESLVVEEFGKCRTSNVQFACDFKKTVLFCHKKFRASSI